MKLGFLGGLGLAFTPIAKGAGIVFAMAKKMIPPKGTRTSTLVGKNHAKFLEQ